MGDQPAIYTVRPVLIERACGGWMAVTPRGWPLSVGVTAVTVAAVELAFEEAMERWSKIGEEKT